jgi:hypothetical protein
VNYGKPQAFLKGIKIAIAVQQGVPFPEAKRCDEAIDRPANSMTALPKDSEVPSRCYREFRAARWKYLAPAEFGKHAIESALVGNALQHLAQNDVYHAQAPALKFCLQPLHLGIAGVAKIINPDRGINDDHGCYSAARPV